MIERKIYQHQLENFINLPFIKIITGIRRSGKSSVLRLLRDQILQRGVLQEQIIHLNFESFVYSDVRTSVQLYK